MKVLSAEFVTSAAAGGASTGIPRDGLLQVAMAGRSNVGKSTLINALCRRPLARTSAAPGKTRLANIYRLEVEGHGPGRWGLYLVDLPGYGYARGGAPAGEELRRVAEAYFQGEQRLRPERGAGLPTGAGSAFAEGYGGQPSREDPAKVGGKPAAGGPTGERAPSTGSGSSPAESREERGWRPASIETGGRGVGTTRASGPRLTLLLVDSRHPGLDSDLQAYEWLTGLGAEPLVVATKVDKLSRAERTRNLRELERIFGEPALPVSAERGEGMDELWKTIASRARAASRRVADA